MRIIRISSMAAQLTFWGFSNCYLVRERDGFTLIDTSLRGCAEQILQASRDLGSQICRVVLTHAHGDHIGSLDQLHHLLGKLDVAISYREAPLLHKDLGLRPNEPQQKPKGSFPGAHTRPTHTLGDGELYGSLRCIATPGHTPGHMSFLDERDGTLYAGDALQSFGGLSLVCDTPWYFPLPKMATWDDPLAVASAQRLLSFAPTTIAPGHGPLVSGGAEALAGALNRANVQHAMAA